MVVLPWKDGPLDAGVSAWGWMGGEKVALLMGCHAQLRLLRICLKMISLTQGQHLPSFGQIRENVLRENAVMCGMSTPERLAVLHRSEQVDQSSSRSAEPRREPRVLHGDLVRVVDPMAASSSPVAAGRHLRLLFAHATGFCAQVWAPVTLALAQRIPRDGTYASVTFDWVNDFTGHGTRGHEDSAEHLQAWQDWGNVVAQDVLRTLDAAPTAAANAVVPPDLRRRAAGAGVGSSAADEASASNTADSSVGGGDTAAEAVVGIGHSMGAAAVVLAEQHRPGTFASIFAFEPIIVPRAAIDAKTGEEHSNVLARMAARRRSSFATPHAAVASFRDRGAFAGWDERALLAYVHHGLELTSDGTYHLRCRPHTESAVYKGGALDAWAHLPDIRCPTTVAAGADTTTFGAEHFREVASQIPGATFVTCPDANHFFPMTDPEECARLVAEHLGWPPSKGHRGAESAAGGAAGAGAADGSRSRL